MLTNIQNLRISGEREASFTGEDAELNTTASNTEDDLSADQTIVEGHDEDQLTTAIGAPPVYSPLSTLSSTASQGPEVGSLRWFSLVATDFQNNQQASGAFCSTFDNAAPGELFSEAPSLLLQDFHHSGNTGSGRFNVRRDSFYLQSPRNTQESLPSWHADVTLQDAEIPILQNYCTRIANWLDVLDPMQHFASALPQLAMRNEGLMKAILALSARHLSIQIPSPEQPLLDQTIALQYYHDTLQYLYNAMKHPDFLKSIEVNATSLILSTYEMIDGMGRGWIRHLKGVFWIQRSQNTSADSGGLPGAIWASWLRQDTWAALREKRKVLTIYNPIIPICDLDFWQHANFISFLFALCVSYMAEESQSESTQLQERIERAKYLFNVLDEWYSYLPDHFKAIPLSLPGFSKHSLIKPIWVNPVSFGAVLQMYQSSRVILLSHAPTTGGFREFSIQNKQLSEAIDAVCGIAMTVRDGGSSFVTTSCLWASSLCSQDDGRREIIVNLISERKNKTGWPLTDVGEELRREWEKWD